MENTNIIFFEEYKKLENICRQMYDGNSGVTSYIEDMEDTAISIHLNIRGWDHTLDYLKRVRHIRNQLAHDATFDIELSTQEDIDWVRDFYDKILHTRDPLALRYQMEQPRKNEAKKVHDSSTKQTSQSSQTMPINRTGQGVNEDKFTRMDNQIRHGLEKNKIAGLAMTIFIVLIVVIVLVLLVLVV
ncbi:DUF6548 family protein [[Clostridium] polysaccharolyticum]|uniref:Uncharacterized protein n=1 Tax=[Clostridium] polysaccharolyticum TaxID=29364 RepID=A0A1I0F9X2_9FIRM|nr:DUF6548 family protein [[Clostridium] polysaccharolyticum]SET54916.1 hypothetical protein SAMN04487772_12913 [[Clostridium] polysaccharolyticum]